MKLRNLNVMGLMTDMSYQSPVKENQVKRIMKNFDRDSLDAITVNLRPNGFYYIIDGQHRVEVLKRLNISTVPAKIHVGLSLEEEAKLYRNINTRPTKSPNSIAKADITQGDEKAELINFSVLQAGMKIDYDNQNPRYGYITAYKALERIFNKYGSSGLVETLRFIKDTFGDEKRFFQGLVMEGFAKFLSTYYNNLKLNELSKRLKQKGFDNFMAEVNKQSPSFDSKKECLPFVVADIYNKRRNENNKLKKLYLRD